MNTIAKYEFPSYPVMIERLFKKIEDGDNPYGTLMHAAVGVVGETIELQDFKDKAHFIEEAGDLEFYLEAMAQAIIANLESALPEPVTVWVGAQSEVNVFGNIVSAGGDIVDLAKKSWVYRKPLNVEGLVNCAEIIRQHLNWLYNHFDTTREEVLYENQVKLIGPEGRFREGFYSDAAAIARADKA